MMKKRSSKASNIANNIKAKTNDKNKSTDIPADVKLNIPKASPNGPRVAPVSIAP